VSAALQIWSNNYCKTFDQLPVRIQQSIQAKVDDLGTRLVAYNHHRLTGRSEYRLRVGDYRVLYEFDAEAGRLFLHYVGHRREIYKSK
jgi:mRNA interferase RelE/StbE